VFGRILILSHFYHFSHHKFYVYLFIFTHLTPLKHLQIKHFSELTSKSQIFLIFISIFHSKLHQNHPIKTPHKLNKIKPFQTINQSSNNHSLRTSPIFILNLSNIISIKILHHPSYYIHPLSLFKNSHSIFHQNNPLIPL
jgi:hypothetical protein